jgi:hypothetical protein
MERTGGTLRNSENRLLFDITGQETEGNQRSHSNIKTDTPIGQNLISE